MNSWAPIARAAASTSASLAPGRPNRMFSATVSANRKFSWVTMTTPRRRSALGEVAQVDAVEPHRALDRVVEAGHQPGDGRLAGAGRADQRDGLPRGDVQVEAGQHVRLAIAEPHVVEVDASLDVRGSGTGCSGSATRRLLVQHAGQLLQRGRRRLERVVELDSSCIGSKNRRR